VRKINYGNRPTHVADPEVAVKKKRMNWDRLVYLTILFAIVCSLLVYLVRNYYFIVAPGQVVKESYLVLLPYDIRINTLLVEEEDSVVAGQPLFRFERDFRLSNDDLLTSTRSVDEWITKERFSAERNIRIKEVEIEQNERYIAKYQKQLDKLKLGVVIEVANRKDVEASEFDILKLRGENNILIEEINYWENYLSKLPRYRKDYETKLLRQLGEKGGATEFLSPIHGRIAELNFKQYEVAYKGEPLLNIEQEDAYIKAYIPQKEFGSVVAGDVVTIIFPNKTKSKGVIDKIYSQLERLPPEYQDEAGPRVRSLLAIVRPMDQNAMEQWKLNDKMNVEIRKPRFFD